MKNIEIKKKDFYNKFWYRLFNNTSDYKDN